MPSASDDVAAAYDRWAATYDIDDNQTRELAAAVLRQQNVKLTDRNVLEIGCGTGRNTQWLIEHGAQVVALDFSAGMLRLAKDRVRSPPARFLQHDIIVSTSRALLNRSATAPATQIYQPERFDIRATRG